MVPTMSILNPEYTFSVSKKQTAAGTADMMSHTMENYFSMENADCQKFMAEGLLRTMIKMDRLPSHSLTTTRPEPT